LGASNNLKHLALRRLGLGRANMRALAAGQAAEAGKLEDKAAITLCQSSRARSRKKTCRFI
jgi:hypothetical protein